MRSHYFIQLLLFTLGFHSVVGQRLFTKIDPAQSGITFINTITESDSLHVMKYEYMYNGHGIGVADFDGDGLLDVFVSGNMVNPALFLNKGSMNFKNITDLSGISYNNTWATGVSVADVNSDGRPDIYVCHSGYFKDSSKLSNELWINQGIKDGIPIFKNMAADFGLDLPGTQSTQAVFFDFDRDGDLDMFLVNHSNHTVNPFLNTRKVRSQPDMHHGNRLLRQDRNNGQINFIDVTLQAGIVNNALNFGLSAGVSDLNGDGWPDIYTTSDYTETDCFYVNNGNGTFTESLRKSFTHVSKYSMGSDIADYNNDGRPDVLTLDMLPEDNHRQKLLKGPDEYDQYHLLIDSGYYHQQMRNMLHLNMGNDENGNTRFSEIGQLAGISNTDWSWAGLFADFDNDGWKDLLVTNGYLRDFTDMDFLKYTVADAQIEAVKNRNTEFRTFDLVKKMPSNKLSSYIFRNSANLAFENVTARWGLDQVAISNCAVYCDLDNDGDLDLLIGRNNEPLALYRNNLQNENFLKLDLDNTIGASAVVYAKGLGQMLENYPVRGYQSSVLQPLFFGMGGNNEADSVKITWPDGSVDTYLNLKSDSTYQFSKAKDSPARKQVSHPRIFNDVTSQSGIDFRHIENDFIDFKDEVLIPYQLSRMGPALAAADVNGDGLSDFFVGGAIGQAGILYIQQSDGRFAAAWHGDSDPEDVNALFFDADNDGDADLYVVSGGNEYEDGSPEYQDRIYINNGKGEFTRNDNSLPAMTSSNNALAAGDFDKDGDLDLFIGGSSLAGSFPLSGKSYLLENNAGKFIIKKSFDIGMINAAEWSDLDGDGFPELVVAGDWEPVRIFRNEKGLLKESRLEGSSGMWAAIHITDYDGDGDLDIIAGNAGTNLQYKASVEKPMEMLVVDIDNNGRIDPLISYEINGKYYPVASRDELLEQVVPLRKKFVYYRDYADATVADIVPKNKLKDAKKMICETLESSVFLNEGNFRFVRRALPAEAQFSKVNGIITFDIDADGKEDMLTAGNFYPYNVRAGSCDASLGMLFSNKKQPVYPAKSGFYGGGDVRKIALLKGKNADYIVLAKNNDGMQLFKLIR